LKLPLLSKFDALFIRVFIAHGLTYFVSFSTHSQVANTQLSASLYPLSVSISLMKRQFIVPHTIRQTDSHIIRQLGYRHIFCQNVSKQNCLCLFFRKNVTCLGVGLLRVGQAFLSPVKLCMDGLRQIAVL
jgi:hypothetical protein